MTSPSPPNVCCWVSCSGSIIGLYARCAGGSLSHA
jgi:hypothetical protein